MTDNNQNNSFNQQNENNPYANQQFYQPPQAPAEEKASVGLAILSFIIPVAGLIIFLVKKKARPKTAKVSGICALVSFILSLGFYIISAVAGGTLFADAVDESLEQDSYSYSESEEENTQNDSLQASEGNALGDYECKVKSASLTTDWEGKDAVIITYEFTNNSSEPMSFDVALEANAYQDGVGLETAITDDDADYFDVEIKPGVTKDVKKVYVLRDTTTPVEVEVSELFSLSDDKVVTTVELQ